MNIVERAKSEVDFWTNHLEEVHEVNRMVDLLPEDIKELDAGVATDYNKGIILTFQYDLPEAREVFRKHGIRKWDRSFSTSYGS